MTLSARKVKRLNELFEEWRAATMAKARVMAVPELKQEVAKKQRATLLLTEESKRAAKAMGEATKIERDALRAFRQYVAKLGSHEK